MPLPFLADHDPGARAAVRTGERGSTGPGVVMAHATTPLPGREYGADAKMGPCRRARCRRRCGVEVTASTCAATSARYDDDLRALLGEHQMLCFRVPDLRR